MAATDVLRHPVTKFGRWLARVAPQCAGLLGGLLAAHPAKAVELPEDHVETMIHVYDGGGVRATGPAFLVRKNIADKVSLSGSYYVDMVSNASIDVVTTASPFKERRVSHDVSADYVYRDALMTATVSNSTEPDYVADSASFDVSQEVFGGMSTVALGFTRAADKVGKKGEGTVGHAKHWQYRLGLTQVLSPRWLASANFEAISDDGYLGSPYRLARAFGTTKHEVVPSTRTSRAVKLRAIGDIGGEGQHSAIRAEYRYFRDTWDIRASTLEGGYSRYFGERWLADGFVRLYSQSDAIFYSDNATTETAYLSRNRQLSAFKSTALGAKLSYTAKAVPGRYEIRLNGSYEAIQFRYSDFTDVRTGKPYSFVGHVLQLYLSANF